MTAPLDTALVASQNRGVLPAHHSDLDALATRLGRRGVDIEALIAKATRLELAIPSWGVGTGGTRFARFPNPGEPRNVFEKIDDCGVIRQLSVITPRVSPHIPWDRVEDLTALRERAAALGLGFDAVNSNTFQDQVGQPLSYKFGSLTHADEAVRAQAIAHNIDCIEIGRKLGSKALTVWIGDGANFPGQQDFTNAFERYLASTAEIYAALPPGWRMFLEHKLFEPAFYATVIQDWGSSLLAAQALGPNCQCLIDLGHHAPNVNIEMIVARLAGAGKLGGFHFNDSKYGDDDLDSGSINPFQLFLVFNELVAAEGRGRPDFTPAYMMDQSHNVTDPVESLMESADAIHRAFVRALLIDREALAAAQAGNDALLALKTLKAAYETDVSPITAEVRLRANGAIDPVTCFRASGYRAAVALARPAPSVPSAGIV